MNHQQKNNFFDSILKFKKLLNAISSGTNINLGEYMLIKHLAELIRKDVTVYVSDVHKLLHISKPAVSQLLNSLEKKGVVCRALSPDDHRKIVLTITPEGNNMLNEKEKLSDEFFGKIITAFGESDTDMLIGLISRFADTVYDATCECLTDFDAPALKI